MKPLIEIKSVPISISYKVTPSQVHRKDMMAEVEISRDKGGLAIKSKPIRLNIDTFEARNSISPSPKTSVAQASQQGMQAAYNATATIAQEGDMMVDIHLNGGEAVQQIAKQKSAPPTGDFNIKFLPTQGPEMDWIPQEMQIKYEMDKLNFDWKTNQRDFEFTPASIEFSVNERPKVVIEYVGGPIYVPPSADPNYIPVDTFA